MRGYLGTHMRNQWQGVLTFDIVLLPRDAKYEME